MRTDYAEVKDKLSAEEQEKFETAATAVEEAIKGDDKDAITQAVSELSAVGQPIINAKQQAQESAPSSAESDKPADDNVVDAEFTEKP
jgi:molecular chaperone DnaK